MTNTSARILPRGLSWLAALTLVLPLGLTLAALDSGPQSGLAPTREHRQTLLIMNKVMEKYHYRDIRLDNDLAGEILDNYLESLDPNRSFFLKADVEEFQEARTSLDDDIRQGDLRTAFAIYNRFVQRVDERAADALQLLERNQFDFEKPERYQFDRSEAPWPGDAEEMHDLWRQRVKNDILSLRLAGKQESEIPETLRKRYEGIQRRVHQLDVNDVFQTFANAYTLAIEPHTGYMSPESSENFDISMSLSLQGIGAVLRSDNEFTQVQSVVTGGPADKSGQLHTGDRIIGVAQGADGAMEDMIGWRLRDVVDKIRGPKGSTVRLSVLPKSEGTNGRAREIVLVRDEIKLEDQAVKSSILEDLPGLQGIRIGVIDVPTFYRDFRGQSKGDEEFRSTTRDVRKVLADLQQEGVGGIIIDLRGNGGGSLSEATELTGLFIEQGPVVQVKDSRGRVEIERDVDPEEVYKGPLLVLVDRNSASASEIFAGAIQDYGRGLIVGETTFGKGTVQTLVDLGQFASGNKDLGRLRLTIAQFFRVQGDSTQHRGVNPDLSFPTASDMDEHGERSLDNALPFASIEAVPHASFGKIRVDDLLPVFTDRVNSDPGMTYLVEQEKEIKALQEQDSLSLVESERRAETEARDKADLERRNKLRAYRGLEPLVSLDHDDEDEDLPDQKDDDPEKVQSIMLEESARLLADYIRRAAEPVTAQAN